MRSPLSTTTGALAELVGGELIGPRDTVIDGFASLQHAGRSHLSLLASRRHLRSLQRSQAGAVLVGPPVPEVGTGPSCYIVVPDAARAWVTAFRTLTGQASTLWGLHPTATIGRGTRWKERIAIGPHARIGDGVRFGTNCVIEAGAVIEHGATLGDDCRVGPLAVVHSGAVLGSRVQLEAGAKVGALGFSFSTVDGQHVRMPHIGGCRIGDDVEIGANTTVDRGSLDDTVVERGTKIDNLVQVAHNVRIGAHCLLMAQVGIAGSSVIEDGVLLGGQAGLADHLTIGRGARVAAQSGVIGDIPPGATVSGYPARRHRDVLRQVASLSRLTPITTSLERLARADDDHETLNH